jgi:GT2 family glycosyltransferase
MSAPDISTIIVSFNTRELLRECLAVLEREVVGLAHQSIVVDNASSDGSAAMVAREFPSVEVVQSGFNLGFGAANNLGFRRALGRYVVLLNSDAFATPGAIRRSLEHMETEPEVGLGGGRLISRDHSAQPSARMFPSPLNELLVISGLSGRHPKSRLLGRPDRSWADPTQSADIDWVPGAYSIIRREALDRAGYFDERFFLYFEEVDLCRRIKAAGYVVRYWPDVAVVHLGGESAKTVKMAQKNSQLTLWRMRSQLLYYRKHHRRTGAWATAALELWWNRLRALKNLRPNGDAEKYRDSRDTIRLLKQAWRETRGGAVAPQRPW